MTWEEPSGTETQQGHLSQSSEISDSRELSQLSQKLLSILPYFKNLRY